MNNPHLHIPVVGPADVSREQRASFLGHDPLDSDLRQLVGSSPQGIVAVDCQGYITIFNKRAEEITGYTEEEMLHIRIQPLYVDPQEPRHIHRFLHTTPDGRLSDHDTVILLTFKSEVHNCGWR